jgi:hypothetical protein
VSTIPLNYVGGPDTAFEEVTLALSQRLYPIMPVGNQIQQYRQLGCASALSPQWIKGRLLLEHRNQHSEQSIGDAAKGPGVLMAGSS